MFEHVWIPIRRFSTNRSTFDFVPRLIKPRNPNLEKFSQPANFPDDEYSDVFYTKYRFASTCHKIDRLLTSTFNSNVLSQSSWDKPSHRISTILYPNKLLETYRKEPVYQPRQRHIKKISSNQIVIDNHKRLDSLWTLSSSHGVSWDKVDQLYMYFIDKHQTCLKQFSSAEPELRQEAATIARELVTEKREKQLEKMGANLSDIPEGSPLRCPRSRFRICAKYIFFHWKKVYLSPFVPGNIGAIMRAEAIKAILLRETNERCLNLGNSIEN